MKEIASCLTPFLASNIPVSILKNVLCVATGCPDWSLPVGYADWKKVSSCAKTPFDRNTSLTICTIEAHNCGTVWLPFGPFVFSCQSGGDWREMEIRSGIPTGQILYAAPVCAGECFIFGLDIGTPLRYVGHST